MNIKKLRESVGLKQTDLAHIARISLAHLQNIENGNSSPTIDIQQRLYEALGFKIEVILAEINYDLLHQIGVPICSLSTKIAKENTNYSAFELSYLIKREYYKAKQQENSRVMEAIEAYMLALKTHFPEILQIIFLKDRFVQSLFPVKILGHHIKLRRIAISLILSKRKDLYDKLKIN